jgi:inward rectifier potassium channel
VIRRNHTNGSSQRPAVDGEPQDLGFGTIVSQQSRVRFLNRDGSFNVERRGLGILSSLSVYHSLLTMPWWRFLCLVVGGYLLANLLFACGYLLCGPDAIAGPPVTPGDHGFLRAFFFSVQTFATIGYGHISPSGLAANLLVTAESLAGLLVFALATGLVFARFSRPTARILFSRNAVIMPYRGIAAFAFRIANQRSNELIEMNTTVMISRFETEHGQQVRRFHPLKLERSTVAFFPLAWTVVHPIDESSPLHGLTEKDLRESDAEFLVLLKGFDETFSQTVHTRSSYKYDEVIWEARFTSMFDGASSEEGPISVDVGKLHDYEPHPLSRTAHASNGAAGQMQD